jgi:hypothetical protein
VLSCRVVLCCVACCGCSVLDLLLSWLPFVSSQARSYSAFFRLLLRLTQRRPDVRRWLIQQGAIGMLVRFYCNPLPILQFNCKANYSSTSGHLAAQQQAILTSSASSSSLRFFHPHRGHLSVSILAILVTSLHRKPQPGREAERMDSKSVHIASHLSHSICHSALAQAADEHKCRLLSM